MNKVKEFPLVNTGATQAYNNKELNKMFETKGLSFLESHPVDVIGRKFNFIPARRGDPPRSETDMPPLKAEYNCTNVGVKSDFPKTISNWENANMWRDGTYEDAKNAINRTEDESVKKVTFAPDYDFELRYNRMAQQNQVQTNIADYFQQQEIQRQIENRIFLEEYGLTGGEVDEVMARIRVEGALQAVKDPKRKIANKRIAFERTMAEAVEQQLQKKAKFGDMDERRVPIEEFIMESSGGPPRDSQARLRRSRSESRFDRLHPMRDDLEPEIDAEPTAFERVPMGGAGGPPPGEEDPRKIMKRPQVASNYLSKWRFIEALESATYEDIDRETTRIDLENILRHIKKQVVPPNQSKQVLINKLLALL